MTPTLFFIGAFFVAAYFTKDIVKEILGKHHK
jgi:hypothetical protein